MKSSMKRFLFLAIAAFCMCSSMVVLADEPATNAASTMEKQYKNYHRIFAGYVPTDFFTSYRDDIHSEWLHGFDVGWLSGFNVTKGRLPMYTEIGVKANAGFGDKKSSFDKFLSIEVPVNFAYRFHIGDTKIHISPYLGLHFKVNAIARDNYGTNYFDIDGVNRFQFGMQSGGHFDFDHFYLGLGAFYDFLPFYDGGYKFIGNFFNSGLWDANLSTCGLFVNVGFVF